MQTRTWRYATAATVLAAATAAIAVALPADGSPAPHSPASLAGTWQTTIEPDPGQPGAPPGAFQSLLEYTDVGGVIEATTRGFNLSGGLGVWQRQPNGTFAVRFQKYRFDVSGAWIATITIRETEILDPTGNHYTGHAITEVTSAAGVVQLTFTSTAHGTRLTAR